MAARLARYCNPKILIIAEKAKIGARSKMSAYPTYQELTELD